MDDFPDELIQVMKKYQPVAMQSVSDQVVALQGELRALQSEIRGHDEWYRRFEGLLESHDKQIAGLLQGLTTEKEAREKGEDKLSGLVSKIDKKLWWLQGAAWALLGIFVVFVVPILVAWILKKFSLT